jgi:hypothetical protein
LASAGICKSCLALANEQYRSLVHRPVRKAMALFYPVRTTARPRTRLEEVKT